MTAIHIKAPVLTLRAGRRARHLLAERGLSAADVCALPGAAGGPKALGIAGLDKAVFGWLAGAPRERELVGASIGGWRFACAMQPDAPAAFDRLVERYAGERFGTRIDVPRFTRQTRAILDDVLGPDGKARLLDHPLYRLTLLLVRCRALTRHEPRPLLIAGMGAAAALNTVSRPLLRHAFSRVLCHDARSALRFAPDDAIPTERVPLSAANVDAALLGTVAIPGIVAGTPLPGARDGVYRDGGLADYHIDFPFQRLDGITLYPHFTDRIVPGWFDKFLPWRRASAAQQANTLLLAPARDYLARLKLGHLPDRRDFKTYAGRDAERERLWRAAAAESERLGDAFLELVESGRIADAVRDWSDPA